MSNEVFDILEENPVIAAVQDESALLRRDIIAHFFTECVKINRIGIKLFVKSLI